MPQRESLPAVTAAAVVAILFGAFGVLFGVLFEVSMLLVPDLQTVPGRPAMPPSARAMTGIVWLFLLAIAVFGIFVGVGILRRRNWARIGILVWGGFMAVISAITIPVLFLVFKAMPAMMHADADVAPVMSFMRWFIVLFYGIPLGVGIWWLILFTRPRVAAAFTAQSAMAPYPPTMDGSGFPLPQPTAATFLAPKAVCPLPLMIFAGFLIFSGFFTLLVAFFPMTGSVPFFFFGQFFSGISAKIFLALMGLVFGISAVGMLKLKPWALHTILVLQCVFFVNGILSVLSPRFLAAMQEAMQRADAENPAFPGGNPFLTGSFLHTILILGLCFSAAIIALLLYYRARFLEAASVAKA